MAPPESVFIEHQLQERRHRLQTALTAAPNSPGLARLLAQVDSALARMTDGSYGICETCHEPIERDRLLADPLACYCLDHLTSEQRRTLEADLELAAQIQRRLLPASDLKSTGWQVHYRYQPAGAVSGDYCDLIPTADGNELLFVLGDVSGKGVAASLLMTQLQAVFRSLASLHVPLERVLQQANSVFCETALAGQYATMICGRAAQDGSVELHNAGHCPALLVQNGRAQQIESDGLPLGMFPSFTGTFRRFQLRPGDSLFLYTDGLSEARDAAGHEYGLERVAEMVQRACQLGVQQMAAACLEDVRAFTRGVRADDLTLLVLQRSA